MVPSYTDSQLGMGLIYDSLLHITYRPLLQVCVTRNLHVAVITVFLELPFVYTGVMVTQHLKPILSQSYWDCMFSITLLCHILHNDLLCTLKGKKHKIYQKLSESLCTSESAVIMMVLYSLRRTDYKTFSWKFLHLSQSQNSN